LVIARLLQAEKKSAEIDFENQTKADLYKASLPSSAFVQVRHISPSRTLQIYMRFIGMDLQLEVQPDGSIKRAQWLRYPTFLAWTEDADLYDDWVPAPGAAVGHTG